MTYTGYEVARKCGIPYRSLQNWVEQGLLNPEGCRRGQRRPATWHGKDLREAGVLAACRRAGFSLQKLHKAVVWLRRAGHNPMSTGTFVVVKMGNGGHPSELIKFCDTGEALALVQQPGQLVLPLLPIKGDE